MTPQENPALVGHGAALAILRGALADGRLPHAWALTGPPGVGKATLAFRFARLLLADGDEAATRDPGHRIFRMVAKGEHPDLRVLRREMPDRKGAKIRKEIVVDQVRGAIEALHNTPAWGGWRVVLVDAADELNSEAANSLLKLLEEPPERTVLLLVIQAPGGLPLTVMSRCARLRLAPLTLPDLRAAVALQVPAELPDAVLHAAEGSPGRALELLDQSWHDAYGELLGLVGRADPLALAELLAKRSAGSGALRATDLLATLVRRAAILAAGQPAPLPLAAGEGGQLALLAEGLGLDRLLALWDKLRALAGRIEQLNLDPLQAFLPLAQSLVLAGARTGGQGTRAET